MATKTNNLDHRVKPDNDEVVKPDNDSNNNQKLKTNQPICHSTVNKKAKSQMHKAFLSSSSLKKELSALSL